MPARAGRGQHHAKEEGIEFQTCCATPWRFWATTDGRVIGIKCVRMELGEPDASGRRRPIAIEGSEFVLDVDTVIMALGTSPNPLIRSTTPGLETNRKGGLIVDEDDMTTRERRLRRRRCRHRRCHRHPRHGRRQEGRGSPLTHT